MIVLTLFLCSVTCSYTDMIPSKTMFFSDEGLCESIGLALVQNREFDDHVCREHNK